MKERLLNLFAQFLESKEKGKREKSSKSKNTPKNLPLKTYVK